jgi:hypothetical protein
MSSPAAERKPVETPAKPRPKRAAAKPAPAKRRPPAPPKPEPAPEPVQVRAARSSRLAAGFAAAAVTAVVGVFLLVGRDAETRPIESGTPTPVTAAELAGFAEAREAPVYWAGDVDSRALELTATDAASFVRYLRGSAAESLTVATYPLADAYATASRRAGSDEMTSRRLGDGGLVVWSPAQPTSVYLAWRGTPALVEVYAPDAAEARAVALSGRVRPVP